jgi:hypothetical protein
MSTLALLALAALAAAPQQSAESESLGVGSVGSAGRPELRIEGSPIVGNPFRLSLTNAKPSASAFVQIGRSATPAYLPTFEATIHLLAPLVASLAAPTDMFGDSNTVLAVEPVLASHVGIEFVAQGIVVDSAAAGGLAFTPTRRIVLGHPASDAPFASENIATGAQPYETEVVDLDNDGNLDLLVALWGAQKLGIHYGTSNGEFEDPVLHPLLERPSQLALGDLNGDSLVDVVVSYDVDENYSVLINTGGRMFSPRSDRTLTDFIVQIDLLDFDSDGILDLFAGLAGDGVGVHLGNGDGTFVLSDFWIIGLGGSLATQFRDLNGDGHLDIAALHESIPFASFLVRLLGDGDGTFTPWPTIVMLAGSRDLASGEFNGDTWPDLVVGRVGGAADVYFGSADGTTTKLSLPGSDSSLSATIDGADFDGDGLDDLLLTGTCTYYLRSIGAQQFAPRTTVSCSGSRHTTVADVDGNGSPDVLRSMGILDQISLLHVDTSGAFESRPMVQLPAAPTAIVTRDFNRDGLQDVAVAMQTANTVAIALGNSTGAIDAPFTVPTGNVPQALAADDIDLDGDIDLLVANRWSNSISVLLGNGDGTFVAKPALAVGVEPRAIAIGDINQDGLPDAVVANEKSNFLSVLTGRGGGRFSVQSKPLTDSPEDVRLADVDGDGDLDAVLAWRDGDYLAVLVGAGDGTFPTGQSLATPRTSPFVTLADLDVDGDIDIVYGSTTIPSRVVVRLGTGNGMFAGALEFDMQGSAWSESTIVVGDVNGDAIPDLLVQSIGSPAVEVMLGVGDGTFANSTTYDTGAGVSCLAIGDVDRNGLADVFSGTSWPGVRLVVNRLVD